MNYKDLAKKKLTQEEFEIIINKATEKPHSGEYNNFFKKGKYYCKLCNQELFDSEHKFESGCGWPSFSKAKNTNQNPDFSHFMIRTEITCNKCQAHLGHVFDDGPLPTRKRYCVNSKSLIFK